MESGRALLADLKLAVQYGIAIRIYMWVRNIFADFNLAVVGANRQTAKFNSPPNFRLYRI